MMYWPMMGMGEKYMGMEKVSNTNDDQNLLLWMKPEGPLVLHRLPEC